MAREFAYSSSQYLKIADSPVTGEPFTLACWMMAYTFSGVDDSLVGISLGNAGDTHYHQLGFRDSTQYIRAASYDGDTKDAEFETACSVNIWYHGMAVFASTTDRRVYVNGVRGTDDTASQSVGTLGAIAIGVSGDSTPYGYLDGRVAEAALWDIVLSDANAVALARGYPPWHIRPGHLVGLWLPFGDRSDRDFGRYGLHMTAYNTPTWAPDPPQVVSRYRIRRYYHIDDQGRPWWRSLGKAPVTAQGSPWYAYAQQ